MKLSQQAVVLQDWFQYRSQYQKHRNRVLNAKSVVNSAAPTAKNSETRVRRELSYMEMLSSIKRVDNSSTFTFTKSPEMLSKSSPYTNFINMNRISRCTMRSRSMECTAITSQRPVVNNEWKRPAAKEKKTVPQCRHQANAKNPYIYESTPQSARSDISKRHSRHDIPDHVLKRYQHIPHIPRDLTLMQKLLRPRVYFDMEVKNVRPLGRLVIQLYTEACPEVVYEFMRACSLQKNENFSITRLFPPMWFEGELCLETRKPLSLPNLEHDTSVLDHGSCAGILSFPSRYVRGSKRRCLNFSISFKPLKVLNGKRIGFGKVRRGSWILDAIQDFGSNSGKPIKEIIVKKCGVLK